MRILLLGHSLIEFGDWKRLLPGHTVASLGRAGETTAGLLGRLDAALNAHREIDAGANSTNRTECTSRRRATASGRMR
jgi:hypothetical protein